MIIKILLEYLERPVTTWQNLLIQIISQISNTIVDVDNLDKINEDYKWIIDNPFLLNRRDMIGKKISYKKKKFVKDKWEKDLKKTRIGIDSLSELGGGDFNQSRLDLMLNNRIDVYDNMKSLKLRPFLFLMRIYGQKQMNPELQKELNTRRDRIKKRSKISKQLIKAGSKRTRKLIEEGKRNIKK